MGILEDLGHAANDAFQQVVHVGQEAGQAVDQATRNAVQFAASGVSANGKIFGPVADIFGKDPTEFVHNVARKGRKGAISLLGRTAERTGRLSYPITTPQGARKVTAKPPANASANQVALTLALACLDSPATMIEEAGRMNAGLPVKARGLAGYTVYPSALPAARGLFGIDDAAMVALLPIVVPIIAAVAAAILPALIAAASNLFAEVTGQNKPDPAAEAAAQQAAEEAKRSDTVKTVALVGGAALLLSGLLWALLRKKHA